MLLTSRSTLLCFLSNCILRTLSANESDLKIVKSSCPSCEFGGIGGLRTVYDSSTDAISNVVVCRRLGGSKSLTSTSGLRSLSSKSGVDVHEDGRLALA